MTHPGYDCRFTIDESGWVSWVQKTAASAAAVFRFGASKLRQADGTGREAVGLLGSEIGRHGGEVAYFETP